MCAGFVLWVGQKPVLESQKEPRGKKDSKGYKQAKKGARSLRYLGRTRSAGDDECLNNAAFVFSVGDQSARRTSASLYPHPPFQTFLKSQKGREEEKQQEKGKNK